ncbi:MULTISPECIES: hypothetical protein [Winogradskyella]|uniref:hypothetical protein n=1 Tax=Winogradskyella TaxID=286104 RepID=UPI0015C9680B|nr:MULTISPECIES: hypothetical protein [Winogradskyella]QXP78759.1 hypothetical protein H0I32_16380 [Winogradskyella sp. HaHa_3_26]
MNKSITFLLLISFLFSCNRNSERIKITVSHYDNLNVDESKWKDIELIKDSLTDLKETKVDLYFSQKLAKIPFYMPTNGIYKDSIKDNECDWSSYPANVKCYEYDNKNRVKSMSVNGSGTMGTWNYQYDELDRITNIEYLGTIYTIKYDDKYGILKEIIKDLPSNLEERIEITYE